MAKDLIHYEKKRSWWDGSSITLCGLKILKATQAGWLQGVTCPACERIKNAS